MTSYAGRFAGRNAIITGGASGLGLAVAQRIVAEGGQVSVWDMNPAIDDTCQHAGLHGVRLDISDAAAVAAAAEESVKALGKVDILICSAGITGATVPVHEFPLDSWLQVVNVNLNGLFYCNRAVVPHLLANGYGRIVNVASVAGKEGNPNASAYSATKAGVIGLVKSMGKDYAETGITVNALAPAVIRTPMVAALPDAQVKYMTDKIPMKRCGELDEAAEMIAWIVSPACSFTTGFTFDLSGGRAVY